MRILASAHGLPLLLRPIIPSSCSKINVSVHPTSTLISTNSPARTPNPNRPRPARKPTPPANSFLNLLQVALLIQIYESPCSRLSSSTGVSKNRLPDRHIWMDAFKRKTKLEMLERTTGPALEPLEHLLFCLLAH